MHMEASAFRVTRMATSAAKLRYLMQQHLLETETLWLLTPQNAMELSRGSPNTTLIPGSPLQMPAIRRWRFGSADGEEWSEGPEGREGGEPGKPGV